MLLYLYKDLNFIQISLIIFFEILWDKLDMINFTQFIIIYNIYEISISQILNCWFAVSLGLIILLILKIFILLFLILLFLLFILLILLFLLWTFCWIRFRIFFILFFLLFSFFLFIFLFLSLIIIIIYTFLGFVIDFILVYSSLTLSIFFFNSSIKNAGS